MKTSIKTIVVLAVLAAFVAGNAFASEGCGFGGKERGPKKRKEAVMRELNLTADQEKRLEEERASHRKVMAGIREALKAKREELHSALAKPDVTKAEVEPIAAQLKNLESQIVDARIGGIFKVKEILTEEQFAKLQSIKGRRGKGGFDKMKRCEKRW